MKSKDSVNAFLVLTVSSFLFLVSSAVLRSPTPASAQGPIINGPFVSAPVSPGISKPVLELPPAPLRKPGDSILELNPRRTGILRPSAPKSYSKDPSIKPATANLGRTPNPLANFDGISLATGGGGIPPDTTGDIGPNHYVQAVNVAFAIFDKAGNTVAAARNINELWMGQGNVCETLNRGDPIVRYDRLADRWLIAQFNFVDKNTAPWFICIAISQTNNPTGTYFLYAFQINDRFPDYLKIGVWPDAYYMSTNEAPFAAYAFDRTKMLAGQALTTFQKFTVAGNNFMLPSDLDGATAPPANSPNYFYTKKDAATYGGVDRLEIYEFKVDFTTPANSTFAKTLDLPTAAFKSTLCGDNGGNGSSNCIPQPGTAQKLDSIVEWPMFRFQYRNLGAYESLVGNFTVDVNDVLDHAGIRWFQLRRTGGAWSIFQQGTQAPDASHRWMGSIAADKDGNIALGYSVSSNAVFPSIRYATRNAGDAVGTMQAEVTLQAGAASQTNLNRWGDYSTMSVDPSDDCTFWYTNEYLQDSAAGWRTRIGSFKMPTCGLVLNNKLYLPLVVR